LKWDDSYRPDRGKVLSKEEIEGLPKFHRYLHKGRRRHSLPYAAGGFGRRRVLHARLGHKPYGGYTEDSTEYRWFLDRLARSSARQDPGAATVIEATGTSDIAWSPSAAAREP